MDRFDLTTANSLVLAVDLQERFQAVIPSIAPEGKVGKAAQTLLQGAKLLGVPTLISEQYPKGLGSTLPHLRTASPEAIVYAKTHFSCHDDPVLNQVFSDEPRSHIILCGVEAHVCLLATMADLLSHGKWVVVAADAVDSRNPQHRDWALSAMRDLGALVLPVESILFRWQRQAGTLTFKALSNLVK